MTGRERKHGHDPEAQHDIEHRDVVTRADVPEVNKDDAQPVERVENNRADQTDLSNTHKGSLVGTNHGVIGLGAHSHESGVQDVDEEEEVNTYAADAVENPGPHALSTAIQRPAGNHAFLAWGGHFNRHRGEAEDPELLAEVATTLPLS